jgi:AcrR family transcriptional regulator
VTPERPRAGGSGLRARPGRPCQFSEPERRQLVLDAAESVFLELGYSTASMDDIARRAGMSKRTLYRFFATKEALFAAVIAGRRAILEAMMSGQEFSRRESPDNVLRSYLGKLARFVLAPRQAALYRLVIAESLRIPELAHAFYREGPCKARAVLEHWLTTQNDQGALAVPDPERDAAMLCSMVISELQMRFLVGELRAPDDAMIDAAVNRAVHVFLRGARAPAAQIQLQKDPMQKELAGEERG